MVAETLPAASPRTSSDRIRVLVQPACNERAFIQPFDESLRTTRREQHIQEERRVPVRAIQP